MVLAAVPARAQTPDSAALGEKLVRLSTKRIFFGHQSVGGEILDGLRQLAAEANVPLDIATAGVGDPASRSVVHALLGENTRPQTKIAAFQRAMDAEWNERADIAFFKFCYVDIDANTDVQKLFEEYVAMYERVRSRRPRVTWVHVTVPLTTTESGLKGALKKLVGRELWGERENMKRHAFNELMRARFQGKEPLFDLALVESTTESGESFGFERDGKFWPSLVPAYTYDGGHLNERGRKRAARALVDTLSSIP